MRCEELFTERIQKIYAVLEKHHCLNELHTFSDEEIDRAERELCFTFPTEFRMVLREIGIGGENSLHRQIRHPQESFNGFYFRRCDPLDFTRGEPLKGGILFQLNADFYGPFYALVLSGELRGRIFSYNDELNRTEYLADDADILCLLERWCECLENGWTFWYDVNYAGDADALINRFRNSGDMDEQFGVIQSFEKFVTDPVQSAICADFLLKVYGGEYLDQLRFKALRLLARLDWKYQFPEIDVQALVLRSENRQFPNYLAGLHDSLGTYCPPNQRAAYYSDLLELVGFYFPIRYNFYFQGIPYLEELLENPAFQIEDMEQFFYSQRSTRTFSIYDFSRFYTFFHALVTKHPHESYISDLLLMRMKYLKQKSSYLELLETASYSRLYIERNPQSKKKLLPPIKEAVRLAKSAMEANEFTESEQKAFQHEMQFIDRLLGKKK